MFCHPSQFIVYHLSQFIFYHPSQIIFTTAHSLWAAAGHVWGHRSALEFFALHLSPDAMAQPVINEGEEGRERRRVLGGAQGGCGGAEGPDTPLAARHFAALVRRGAEASRRERGPQECRVGTIKKLSRG